jgi:hypothetical protein
MYLTTKYAVTFMTFDGNTIETQTVAYGKTATAPAAPARDGYAFEGWNDGTKVYTMLPAIYDNVTFTAKYVSNAYTVVYYDEDGTPFNKTEVVKHGESIKLGFVPEKAADDQNSYTFDKWVTVKGGTQAVGLSPQTLQPTPPTARRPRAIPTDS